jgi:hypothetical protein
LASSMELLNPIIHYLGFILPIYIRGAASSSLPYEKECQCRDELSPHTKGMRTSHDKI